MKTDLLNPSKLIAVNGLDSVTNPITMNRDATPTSDGLLSLDVFGKSMKDRMNIYAYIPLNTHFFHPHVYKILKRFAKDIINCVNGTEKYILDADGNLIKDADGNTGIQWVYDNWNKIKFNKGDSTMRNERIELIDTHKKDEIFIQELIVIPAHYRDVDASGKQDMINELYAKLIRLTKNDKFTTSFDFVMYAAQSSIQDLIVEIYDYFKTKVEKKNGIIRKFLMGKSVDYCARMIITAPPYRGECPEDQIVDIEHCGLPLPYTCALFLPFMVHNLNNWMNSNIKMYANNYMIDGKPYRVNKPEIQFSDDKVHHVLETFVFNYEDRFEKVAIELLDDNDKVFVYHPKTKLIQDGVEIERELTWCDVLYKIALDVISDKTVNVSRYPITDYFGTTFMKINITTTVKDCVAEIDGVLYNHYPKIDLNMPEHSIATTFIDTLMMSNVHLEGYGGDYDGDQVTVKPIFSQEANAESKEIIESLKSVLYTDCSCVKSITNEFIETFYQLTRN